MRITKKKVNEFRIALGLTGIIVDMPTAHKVLEIQKKWEEKGSSFSISDGVEINRRVTNLHELIKEDKENSFGHNKHTKQSKKRS